MGYELHIEGREIGPDEQPVPIPLKDWCAAVAMTQGVRLFAADAHTFTNPKTGEVISIGKREGDAEVFFPEEAEWHAVFRWFEGSAAFSARFEPGHPVWSAAVALARQLNAVIRGDGGELYDLESGQRTRA
jgi:hypothetical protein